ncbi:MAG: sugar phosphate isomerase/epimerase family protein [Christensenellales bacterium]|jgi:sugar phosphate isomerase/epimerase
MKRIPIAVQLYSVHKSMAKDMEGTIRAVAEIGYKGVEFYSGVEKDAPRVRKILQETGLRVVGWHSAWDDLTQEHIDDTVRFHKEIGNDCIVVPGLPAEMTADAAAWSRTAALFSAAQKALTANGLHMGYHNHNTEFTPISGEDTPWDIIAKRTPPEFILQLDNGNAMSGGADPLKYLKKYPGRARTIHLKPYSFTTKFDTMIGEDDVQWIETFEEIERQNATRWYIMEYESEALYPSDIEGIRVCFEKLKAFGL